MLADQAKVADVAVLVAQAKDGNAQAFDRLMEIHAPGVYNLALRITRSREAAEDCVQETFLRAYHGLPRFRGEAAFSTWLYQVALNVAREAVKKLGRDPVLATDLAGSDPDASGDLDAIRWQQGARITPEEAAVAAQRRRVVLRAIEALPPHHREVIILYDLQGLSYEEIARVLRVRVGTVKSRLSRARLALKESLSEHMELLRE